MAKALDVLIDQEFVSKLDEDETPTTWMLRSLTGVEYLECFSTGKCDHNMILSRGITGWKNFPDKDGNEIEFSIGNINRIPAPILQDISFEIQGMSSLNEEERKNL